MKRLIRRFRNSCADLLMELGKRLQQSQPYTQAATTFISQVGTRLWSITPKLKMFASLPKLIIINPKDNKKRKHTIPLIRKKYTFGRNSQESDYQIAHDRVSGQHFTLTKADSEKHYTIRDINSKNGLYYRGKQLTVEHSLRPGDKLTLGNPNLKEVVTIRYIYPKPLPLRIAQGFVFSILGLGLFASVSALLIILSPSLPNVGIFPELNGKPTVVVARGGEVLLNPLTFVPNFKHLSSNDGKDFPKLIRDAVLASEDSRFYWHPGIDPIGIVRALRVRQQGGDIQGASTLTQQVARSLFPYVGRETTLVRKIREAMVAFKIEFFHGKRSILFAYMNNIFLGGPNYGFLDAALTYFDKPLSELTISETATLVAFLPKPNDYAYAICHPRSNLGRELKNARDRVITRMATQKRIRNQDAVNAMRQPIQPSVKYCQNFDEVQEAPFFTDYVLSDHFLGGKRQVSEFEGLMGLKASEGNFVIQSTLDYPLQKEAEASLEKALINSGVSESFDQGAILTLDAKTGEILAMVGGKASSYVPGAFNRTIQAHRQSGSTFKLFAYLTALEKGISPEKLYSCSGLTWSNFTYQPCQRSGGSARITMAQGLARSENPVVLRIAQEFGLSEVIATAKRLGIESELEATPGLVLGQEEAYLLEMTRAYAVIANGGKLVRPHSIARIQDTNLCEDNNDARTCTVVYTNQLERETQKQVVDPEITQTLTGMLQQVVAVGTGRNARLNGVNVAGKTGTTDDRRDLWFIGYFPEQQFVTGVWLGNDNAKATGSESSRAAQVWADYMQKAIR